MKESNTLRILEALAAELERKREVTPQVERHLTNTYAIDRDAMGPFLTEKLPELEDDEVDLILSPLFTPKLTDQAVFADALGVESISRHAWPDLVQALQDRPTIAHLVTPDGSQHSVTLREVTIERFVYRLRLDGTIPAGISTLLEGAVPSADRSMLKAVARRSIWENSGRTAILERYLNNALRTNSYRLDDALELLNRAESYRPADLEDLLARIPRWQAVLEEEIQAGDTRPFFSVTIRDSHGGERDQRTSDDARLSTKERELAVLNRLQRILTASTEPLPGEA